MTETLDKSSERRYRGYLETELRAAGAYKAIAETEKDPNRAAVFEKLVEAELRHASRWAEKLGLDGSKLELPAADLKLRLFQLTARVFGTRRVLPWLLRGEAREIDTYASDPEAQDLAVEERRHALILRELAARWPMGAACGRRSWA